MPQPLPPSHPVLSLEATRALEDRIFGGDEAKEWEAMSRAGSAVAEAVLGDLMEAGGLPTHGRILVLAGRGNNAGDALIAARAIVENHPRVTVRVVFGERGLRPLARRAWLALSDAGGRRVEASQEPPSGEAAGEPWDVCLDGVFGFNFRPPLSAPAGRVLAQVNRLDIRLRAAVDLPSGLDEPDGYRADFTYATGVVKETLVDCRNAGRPRYLDLGFFRTPPPADSATDRILLPSILAPLAGLRSPEADKRSQGHVLIVAGSLRYPGAALMAVQGALHSGAGLVTAFVPESLVPSFAAQAPGALWVGWPETPGGSLALEGRALLAERWDRADALVIGPGLGREGETLALAEEIVRRCPAPLVVDADALQERIVRSRSAARGATSGMPEEAGIVLTPHAGEFARITGGAGAGGERGSAPVPSATLSAAARHLGAVIALKGPVTRVCSGGPVFHSLAGGPVLARGGSGDVLAGLAGGLLAQTPKDLLGAVCRAVVWQGRAADLLARTRGQTAVLTPEVLDFLAPALRESVAWSRSRAN